MGVTVGDGTVGVGVTGITGDGITPGLSGDGWGLGLGAGILVRPFTALSTAQNVAAMAAATERTRRIIDN